MNIGLDTNVIRDVIDKFESIDDLPDYMLDTSNRIYLANTALKELFDISPIADKAVVLKKLYLIKLALDRRFRISKSWQSLFKEELISEIKSQPVIEINEENLFWSKIDNNIFNFETKLQDYKTRLMIADTQVVNEFSPNMDIKEVANSMENFSGPSKNGYWLMQIQEWFPFWSHYKIFENPKRYPAIWNWACMSEYYTLGLMLNKNHKYNIGDIAMGTRKNRGFHHDIVIYSELIYCDKFITRDTKIIEFVKKLSSKNYILNKI